MDSFAPFGWLRTIPRTVAIGALLLFGGAADAQTDDGAGVVSYSSCPAYGTAGECVEAFNIEECDYSDHNCCWCDCTPVEYCEAEGDASYNCIDPDSACFEGTPVDETPAPAVVVVETPGPTIDETPAPAVVETPGPMVDETSAPAVVETPEPTSDETPAPTVVETPGQPVATDDDDFLDDDDDVEDDGQPLATYDDDSANDATTPEPSLGDSTTATTTSSSACTDQNLGDGYCDEENNIESCQWDDGDCCECTCDTEATYTCGSPAYDCQDPRGTTCDLEEPDPDSSPSLYYNANFLVTLGISCAMVFSMVATPNYY